MCDRQSVQDVREGSAATVLHKRVEDPVEDVAARVKGTVHLDGADAGGPPHLVIKLHFAMRRRSVVLAERNTGHDQRLGLVRA